MRIKDQQILKELLESRKYSFKPITGAHSLKKKKVQVYHNHYSRNISVTASSVTNGLSKKDGNAKPKKETSYLQRYRRQKK